MKGRAIVHFLLYDPHVGVVGHAHHAKESSNLFVHLQMLIFRFLAYGCLMSHGLNQEISGIQLIFVIVTNDTSSDPS